MNGKVTYPSLIVGKYRGEYLKYSGQDFLMLAAGARQGKGTAVVIPNCLTYTDSMVILDIKEENFRYTSGYRHAHGQEVYLWAPFSESGESHAFNPFDFIYERPAHLRVGDVMAIGEQVYPGNVDAKLKFFNDNARNLFAGIALYLLETPDLRCTFGEIMRQASGKGRPVREHLASLIASRAAPESLLPPLSYECTDALNRFLSEAKETFSNILSTMTGPLTVFTNPVVDAATCRSDFKLGDVRKKRMTIYVGMTPNRLKEGALLANLFFSQLLDLNTTELAEQNPELQYQCCLMMDEFTAPGKINIIANANQFIAGYNMRLVMIYHSMAQLSEIYGKEVAQTLAVNTKMRSLFAPRELSDSEEYSKMLGQFTMMATSKGRSRGKTSSTSENTSDHGRSLMLPQELRMLESGKQIIVYEGCPPILCDKAYFYNDPNLFGRLIEQSPYLQQCKAGHDQQNESRSRWKRKDFIPSEVQLKHAAFVARDLSSHVPVTDVAAWWCARNAERLMEQSRDATLAEIEQCDVRDIVNHAEINAALQQWIPTLKQAVEAQSALSSDVAAATPNPNTQNQLEAIA